MTRSRQIIDIVNQIGLAADHMLSWMRPGGVCCLAPRDEFDYCTRESCRQRQIDYAVSWAKVAGHYANRLIDLAKKGEAA